MPSLRFLPSGSNNYCISLTKTGRVRVEGTREELTSLYHKAELALDCDGIDLRNRASLKNLLTVADQDYRLGR